MRFEQLLLEFDQLNSFLQQVAARGVITEHVGVALRDRGLRGINEPFEQRQRFFRGSQLSIQRTNIRNRRGDIGTRFENALTLFVEQSLARCAFRCNHALVAIEDWHIDRDIETATLYIGIVLGADKRQRHPRKLREDGGSYSCILALVTLAQSEKIQPARLNMVK